ncbi:NADPH-dependent FMN reductase [Actinoplanes sp. SE50]|uniref:NADPH-dependent FMN reductase n=1 Tax=unclassified Actinoplanes TaxID=2626549 RepID=UPI00023ECDF0|nr:MULTISPECIES: NADPH-dependent FMN reductase [unclassified Actinoplanes]AEV82104.1 NADPH azoreductase [Actinoplanes sp. SE50/110]ATO80503.1 NADPH-dependent FMN reductase [Actinoplanes sp. SE50]SLL97909.1 FMN reductase [Actinoplanes sp. SE50/110]
MACVLLISGSTREGSVHTAALRTAARFAPAEIDARLYSGLAALPAFLPGDPAPPASVVDLRRQVAAADAVMISTPEYAGALPGSLKNLFDWLVDGGDLTGKPAAWLSVVAPGQDEGARAGLESVLEHGGARLLRAGCVRVPLDVRAVDERGLVDDPLLHRAVQDVVQALIRSLAGPRPQPSWQVHSSVYPVITRNDAPSFVRRPDFR